MVVAVLEVLFYFQYLGFSEFRSVLNPPKKRRGKNLGTGAGAFESSGFCDGLVPTAYTVHPIIAPHSVNTTL